MPNIKFNDLKIGDVFESKNYGRFKILRIENAVNIKIEFIETGYVKFVPIEAIRLRGIKDPMKPSVYGVGYKGDKLPAQVNGKMIREYVTWKEVLRRCYDEKHLQRFPTYRGCTVCERWHSYENFYEDIKKLEGYSEWINNPRYQIDKDTIKPLNKVYCPEYCKFVTDTENSLDANRRRHNRV